MSDQNPTGQPQDPNQQPAQPPAQPGPPPVPPAPAYNNPPPPAGPPAGTYGGQPGYGGGIPQATPDTSTNAILALVLAIVSWAVCPIILAIVALVIASNAKKEIIASNGWKTGLGLVTATKWIAWINIIIWPIFIILYIIFVVVLVSTAPSNGNYYNDYRTPGMLLLSLVG